MVEQHAGNTAKGNRHLENKKQTFLCLRNTEMEHSFLNSWECISFIHISNCVEIDGNFPHGFHVIFSFLICCSLSEAHTGQGKAEICELS